MPLVQWYFDGVLVSLNYVDHYPPHFHAAYAEYRAVFYMSGELMIGNMPKKKQRSIRKWAARHQDELMENWHKVKKDQTKR